jgi:hypothetical protein
MMLTASLRADMPAVSMLWFRIAALTFFALDLGKGLAAGDWLGIEFWLFVLIAEYAATIRTIPPCESKASDPNVTQIERY